jgi:autoinducer 2-degrading protein
MIVNCVYIEVKPESVSDFIKECEKNHNESIKEPGNLRFDVLQDAENLCKFTLYEAYKSDEASAEHKQTKHYMAWRQNIEHMMAKPRYGVKHNIIFPTQLEKW